MKILPLLKEQVPEYWPFLLNGFKEVLLYSNRDDSLSNILSSALNGSLIIWIGIQEEKLVGLLTTRYRREPDNCLIIDHAWQSQQFKPFSFTEQVFKEMEEYAKKLECKCIRTYSLRNIEKYCKKYGYKPSYTEYIKELRDENN